MFNYSNIFILYGVKTQDALSIKTEDRSLWVADEITFNKRKRINFGL